MSETPFVITVARGFGSGGKQIASMLADRLNINCYETESCLLRVNIQQLIRRKYWREMKSSEITALYRKG
jgi:hypothetical protein